MIAHLPYSERTSKFVVGTFCPNAGGIINAGGMVQSVSGKTIVTI